MSGSVILQPGRDKMISNGISTPLVSSDRGASVAKMKLSRNVMFAIIGGGILVILIVVISVAVTSNNKKSSDGATCPADFVEQPPLLLLSLDGFRASYLDRGLNPILDTLRSEGVTIPYMNPSYPTVTFPNHYSIVTGLYPESHGIIANSFYDDDLADFFSLDTGSSEGKWWGGEPLWNTLTLQGKRSYTYFWPGSEANITGMYPTHYEPYNGSIPFETRVDTVLEWISLPSDERPHFISLYFDEPDSTGHHSGPDTEELNDKLTEMNSVVERLVNGLTEKGLLDCVNLIILADHGMAPVGPAWTINVADYIPDIYDRAYVRTGAFARIDPKDESDAEKYDIMNALKCQRSDLRQYEKNGLPRRFHFTNNKRIEEIVLDVDAGRIVASSWYISGNHGYDNYFPVMNALFLARGPDFQVGITADPFQNIELYNLMAYLLKVSPAANNGTYGSLNHILKNPPSIPELVEPATPSSPSYPDDQTLPGRLGISGCDGDLTAAEDWLQALDLTTEQQTALREHHLPWGVPFLSNSSQSIVLLYQNEHIIGYSEDLKMALWSSFSVSSLYTGSPVAEWSSDVRLDAQNTATCGAFAAVPDTVMAPLFPPAFSTNSSLDRLPFLVSNAALSTTQHQIYWNELLTIVQRWISYGELNVIVGPAFDNDADSHIDEDVEDGTSAVVLPSHWFAIVTRCSVPGLAIKECEAGDLDSRAFIYPTVDPVPNCLEPDRYALEFSSTVRDVTKISGLKFFPSITFAQRTKLEITVHSELW